MTTMTTMLVVLLGMIYMHVIDDYVLQGVLAKMKQKEWWNEVAPYGTLDDSIYRRDYVAALLAHGFSWSFSVSIPLLAYAFFAHVPSLAKFMCAMIPGNALIHAYVDNAKANRKCISLVTDQALHMLQIAYVWGISLAFVL